MGPASVEWTHVISIDGIFTKGPKVEYVELNAWNPMFWGETFSDVCDLGGQGFGICHCCEDGMQMATMDSLPFLLKTCYYQTSIRGFQVPPPKKNTGLIEMPCYQNLHSKQSN